MLKTAGEVEKLFKALAETTAAALFVYLDTFLYANPASERLTGYTRLELLGMRFWELVHPDHQSLVRERGRLRLAGKTVPDRYEFMIVTKTGEVRWVDFTASNIDLSGSPAGIGTAYDITERKRAEQALQTSETRYRSIFDASQVSLWEEDYSAIKKALDGLRDQGIADIRSYTEQHPAFVQQAASLVRILDVNDATLRLYQARSKEELLEGLAKVFTPESYAAFREELIAIAEGRRHFSAEATNRTLRGERRDILISIGIPEAVEGFERLIVSITDITERKRAEAAQQRNEHVLRLFVEHAPAAIAMFDNDMKYIAASRRFLTDYNLGSQDIVGRSHYEVFPEMTDRLREIHRRCLAGAIEKSEEDSFQRVDGTTEWVRWEMRPWYETQGEIGGAIFFSEVITERKRSEQALHEAHQRLAATIENMSDAFVSLDTNWRYTYMNRKAGQIFQRDPASLIGKHIWTEFPEGAGQPFHRAYEKAVREQQAVLLEEYYPPYDKWFENRIFPSPEGLAIFFSDITERKKAEQELERHRKHLEELVRERTADLQDSRKALMNIVEDLKEKTGELAQANEKLKEVDRLKSLFIASMSHELRTPLNSIIGFTGILLQGLAGPMNEEQKKQLGMVKGSSEHLLSLITDIIDLSKIKAGKIDLDSVAFDLPDLVREVIRSLLPAAERKGLTLTVEAPAQLMVMSDPKRVRQVLVNLVENAVKFTESGGVFVSVQNTNGMVEVSVRDTGHGIRAEDMPRLFQSFSQIVTEGVAKHEGSGLGLYLSKKLVTLLGGEIRAESAFGAGNVFRFTLPEDKRYRP